MPDTVLGFFGLIMMIGILVLSAIVSTCGMLNSLDDGRYHHALRYAYCLGLVFSIAFASYMLA